MNTERNPEPTHLVYSVLSKQYDGRGTNPANIYLRHTPAHTRINNNNHTNTPEDHNTSNLPYHHLNTLETVRPKAPTFVQLYLGLGSI
jgi:hypothetical protein